MSCRHDLANGTCRRCYPTTGTIDPGPEEDYEPNLDGPGAITADGTINGPAITIAPMPSGPAPVLTGDPLAAFPVVAALLPKRPGRSGTPLHIIRSEANPQTYFDERERRTCARILDVFDEVDRGNRRIKELEAGIEGLYVERNTAQADLRAAIDERDRAQAALAAEREVSDSRAQRIAALEGIATGAACAIDIRLTAEPGSPDLHLLDEALATVSREAKALLGADPHVDARDQPELMRRSEVKA